MSLSEADYPTYPVNLKLDGADCLVVGGGSIAARKVKDLLRAGAIVRVVSPELCSELKEIVGDKRVTWREGRFSPGDVAAARLVIAATDDSTVNQAVVDECRAKGIWINVVDDPPRCDFYVPAVLQRGEITIAVSTGGSSPALAGHVRDRVSEAVGPEYAELAEILGELRDRIKKEIEPGKRLPVYRKIIASPVLGMIRDGAGRTEIMSEIEKCISSVSA
jgi:precorrin-2 dehydrogenase/sirohydrochlorin ferrochelatase